MENQKNTFLGNLEWRRAVKHFGREPIDIGPIVKAIVNAPSSFGMQPYRVVAVREAGLKHHIRHAAYNQAQVEECDTLFVFCARTDLNERAEEFIRESGAGFVCKAGDSHELAKIILHISLLDSSKLATMGKKGKVYNKSNFNRDFLITKLEKICYRLELKGTRK